MGNHQETSYMWEERNAGQVKILLFLGKECMQNNQEKGVSVSVFYL